ncbi:iron (III) dicitrate ABC transporter substrate-binding protein precursor [Halobacillus sp. BAB-2008]|nr:iron (III) dicitrate ABC transporter substrate-binding protein precursor [Halobacillus sp. BAB-2008]
MIYSKWPFKKAAAFLFKNFPKEAFQRWELLLQLTKLIKNDYHYRCWKLEVVKVKATKFWLVTIFCIAGFVLAGCGAESANQEDQGDSKEGTRTIEHQLGKTEIEGTPERVVALEFSFVDSLWELGMTPVGIAHENDDDVEGLLGEKIDYTSVGTRQQPSLEVIASLQPDLIIADENRHSAIYDQLQEIAPTIVLKSRNSTYEENLESFSTIGKAVGKEKEAEERLEEHKKTIESYKSEVDPDEDREIMLGVFRSDSLSAHGAESFDGQLLSQVGIPNAIKDAKEPTVKITLEQMVEWDPDVIFLVEADEALLEEWKQNPLWNNITAVKNGEIYEVDRALWTRYRGLKSAERIVDEATEILYDK